MHMAPVAVGCGCDSLTPPTDMMSVPEARNRALALVVPIQDAASVCLADATGRTTARPIFAPHAMPFFDNSAMDGFALRRTDLEGRCCLPKWRKK